jgi:hypothetical protein
MGNLAQRNRWRHLGASSCNGRARWRVCHAVDCRHGRQPHREEDLHGSIVGSIRVASNAVAWCAAARFDAGKHDRPPPARADEGFRCGTGRLVSAGDHMYDVRNKCGEPDAASQRVEKRKVKHKVIRWVQGAAEEVTEEREIEVPVDEWIYDLGSRRFTRFVIFENDRVRSVITGAYGTRKRT